VTIVRKRELFYTVYFILQLQLYILHEEAKHDPISQLTIAEYLLMIPKIKLKYIC